jgi:hypothetical protein
MGHEPRTKFVVAAVVALQLCVAFSLRHTPILSRSTRSRTTSRSAASAPTRPSPSSRTCPSGSRTPPRSRCAARALPRATLTPPRRASAVPHRASQAPRRGRHRHGPAHRARARAAQQRRGQDLLRDLPDPLLRAAPWLRPRTAPHALARTQPVPAALLRRRARARVRVGAGGVLDHEQLLRGQPAPVRGALHRGALRLGRPPPGDVQLLRPAQRARVQRRLPQRAPRLPERALDAVRPTPFPPIPPSR